MTAYRYKNNDFLKTDEKEEALTDENIYYGSLQKVILETGYKATTIIYHSQYLINFAKLKKSVKEGTYKTGKKTHTVIHERGKTRSIKGSTVKDRIFRDDICENIIDPILERYLIYDSSASRKKKGVSFARDRLIFMLRKFYMKYGTNKGYILLCDISKYYDNIRHDILLEELRQVINNGKIMYYCREMLDSMKIDVSYMSDDEYSTCLSKKFDSLEYLKIPDELKTGKKYMRKSIDIGDRFSQDAGNFYLHRLDDYIKIVLGVKLYHRFADDFFIISDSKEELKGLLEKITEYLKSYSLELNKKKTQICRIDKPFHFLQDSYRLSDTGKVYEKINKKKLVKERRRLKSYRKLIDDEKMTFTDVYNCFISWLCTNVKHKKHSNKEARPRNVLSRNQKRNIIKLFAELYARELIMDELHTIKLKDGTTFTAYLNGNNYLPTDSVVEDKLSDGNLTEVYIDDVKHENLTCCNYFMQDDKLHIVLRQYSESELATIKMKKIIESMGIKL